MKQYQATQTNTSHVNIIVSSNSTVKVGMIDEQRLCQMPYNKWLQIYKIYSNFILEICWDDFTFILFTKYYCDYEIKENMMGEARSTNGRHYKLIQTWIWKYNIKIDHKNKAVDLMNLIEDRKKLWGLS
jgi:hypothetical protein